MSDFFNKYFNINQIMKDKREYKEQMARVDQLPTDYQFVFRKIQTHMWMFASGDGMDMLEIQYELIDLFETGAINGKKVLEITGDDVALFCEELLKNAKTYTENWRDKLNREIHEKIRDKK